MWMSVQIPRSTKLQRRDFQFSLTRLFVAITLSGILLAFEPPLPVETAGWGAVSLLVLLVLLNDWSLWYVNNAEAALRHCDYERAVSEYTKAIGARPDDVSRYCGRAAAHLWRGEPDPAMRDYANALELDPQSADAWAGKAWAWHQQREYQRSIDEATLALCYAPAHIDALMARGHSHCLLGEHRVGMGDLDESVKIAPRDWRTHFMHGMGNLCSHNNEAAIADFQQSIRCGGRSDVIVHRAVAAFRLGQFEEAVRHVQYYVESHADDAFAKQVLSWFLSTCPTDSIRDGQRALDLARSALNSDEAHTANSEGCLASALAEMGQSDQAVSHGKRAIELSPPAWRDTHIEALAAYESGEPYRVRSADGEGAAGDQEPTGAQ